MRFLKTDGKFEDTSKDLTAVQASYAETVLELQKTRDLLLLQHRLNADLQVCTLAVRIYGVRCSNHYSVFFYRMRWRQFLRNLKEREGRTGGGQKKKTSCWKAEAFKSAIYKVRKTAVAACTKYRRLGQVDINSLFKVWFL